MYRVYFWMLGIPKDRPTGPWWWISQPSMIMCYLLLADMAQFLQAYAIIDEAGITEEDKKEVFIVPPKAAKIVYPHKEERSWESV
jgi:hypothetical protein